MEVYKQCFLRELAKGKSPTHAAQVAGLARSTAYLFRSQDPEFARQGWKHPPRGWTGLRTKRIVAVLKG